MTYDPNTPSQPSYPAPQGGSQQGYGAAPTYSGGNDYPPASQDSNGIGLAGFILSLVSIVTMFFGLFGLIVCVVAIALSAVGLSKANKGAQKRGLCLAGVIIGIVTTIVDIIVIVAVLNALT